MTLRACYRGSSVAGHLAVAVVPVHGSVDLFRFYSSFSFLETLGLIRFLSFLPGMISREAWFIQIV
jgi:hypothetical protein